MKTVGLANLKREQREVILLAEKDIFVALLTVTGRGVPSEFVGELELRCGCLEWYEEGG